jgi:hypothetical protein
MHANINLHQTTCNRHKYFMASYIVDDMIHSISSCDLIVLLIVCSLALHYCTWSIDAKLDGLVYTCPTGRAGPVRHEGRQSKPGTIQCRAGPGRPTGWLTQPRLGTVILIWAVPGRRHDGPVMPGRARKHKKNTLKFRI